MRTVPISDCQPGRLRLLPSPALPRARGLTSSCIRMTTRSTSARQIERTAVPTVEFAMLSGLWIGGGVEGPFEAEDAVDHFGCHPEAVKRREDLDSRIQAASKRAISEKLIRTAVANWDGKSASFDFELRGETYRGVAQGHLERQSRDLCASGDRKVRPLRHGLLLSRRSQNHAR